MSRKGNHWKEIEMSEHRAPFVERIIHRVEDHLEEWRTQDAARKAEAEADRERLWAEAMERERLLAAAVGTETAGRESVEEIAAQQRVAFVVHSGEMAQALEIFASDKLRLVNVVPGKGTSANGSGISGSWLVFEDPA